MLGSDADDNIEDRNVVGGQSCSDICTDDEVKCWTSTP